jgi:AbrB family looped-hinge helix DNA binding protein
MKITVSTKGQVVIPLAARAKYRIEPGDQLDLVLQKDEMRLVPIRKRRKFKPRMIKDPITGMDVLTLGPGAPPITSEQVKKLLEDFP